MPSFDVNSGLVISQAALEKRKVNYIYREEPHNPKDSGWRLFFGTEDESIAEEANDMAIFSLDYVLAFEPGLEEVFASEHDDFEWNQELMKFIEVHE